jgi:ABC-type multidrug transport system fused ATPase/permease subunit
MSLSEKAYLNLTRLSRTYYHIQDAEPSIERFKNIFAEETKLKDVDSDLIVTEGKIEFKDVSFSYSSRAEALKNLSFVIAPKETFAFVGRSGSGKTTTVKLLLRLVDCDSGDILIDGKSTKEYSFKNLRGGMAIVAQDVELFNSTIAENIAYGAEGATEQEIIEAAKLAHAHEFVSQLEHG